MIRLNYAYRPAAFLACLILLASANVRSADTLMIEGDDSLPGIIGAYPLTATFSWMLHKFPSNSGGHSWVMGPGADSGVLFQQAQVEGEMMGIRPVFNQPTTFFSVNTGLSLAANGHIDMANLRMIQAGDVLDVGSGSGFDTDVPRVADIKQLQIGKNGWMLVGSQYHLVYYTRGGCAGCEVTLYLYGQADLPSLPTGDINGDSLVDILDVLLGQRILIDDVGITNEQLKRADVAPLMLAFPAPDGQFDIADLLVLMRKVAGGINF